MSSKPSILIKSTLFPAHNSYHEIMRKYSHAVLKDVENDMFSFRLLTPRQ